MDPNASSPISPKPFGLMDLPMELITTIIDYIQLIYGLELLEKLKEPEVELLNDHPVFNFASTNRKFYHICCPYLWRTISYPGPGSKTGASDMWIDDIFSKHGHHVKDLYLHLYDDSIPLSDEMDDNDQFLRKSGTSASKAIEFLTQCPNITRLTIQYQKSHCRDSNETLDRTEAYLARIIPAIAGLEKLRDLTVKNYNRGSNLSSDFIPNLLDKIPPLETLRFGNIPSAGPNHDAGALGLRLSQIKSLKQLELDNVRDVSDAWCEYPWQNQITMLGLSGCGNGKIGTAHRIVHHIAPRLKYLKLDCRSTDDALEWDPQNQFSLPELSVLGLGSVVPNVLSSFRDCKAIRELVFHPFTHDHYVTMDGLVREIAWPKLERLETSYQPQESVNTFYLILDLGEFCHTRGIQTLFPPPPEESDDDGEGMCPCPICDCLNELGDDVEATYTLPQDEW